MANEYKSYLPREYAKSKGVPEDRVSKQTKKLKHEMIEGRRYIIDCPENFKLIKISPAIIVKVDKDSGLYYAHFRGLNAMKIIDPELFNNECDALLWGCDMILSKIVTFLS